MGRASKTRGPIGHNRGQVQYLPDPPGERKAPWSLAPWQLPPKVSAAGDVPTRATHQRKGTSCRTAVAARECFQKPGDSLHNIRPASNPYDPAPVLIRRSHGPHLRQLETDTQERPVQPVRSLPRIAPARHVVDARHPQTAVCARDVETVTQPVLTRASHLAHLCPDLDDASSTFFGPGQKRTAAAPVPSGTGDRCVPSRTTPVAARRGGGPVSVWGCEARPLAREGSPRRRPRNRAPWPEGSDSGRCPSRRPLPIARERNR